jgi:hypothetical protein
MTTTEIIGLISFILSVLGGAYAFMRKIDIREENEKEHKELGVRLDEGSDRFKAIETQLSQIQITLSKTDSKVSEIDRNYTNYLRKLDEVAEQNQKILLAVTRLETLHEGHKQ